MKSYLRHSKDRRVRGSANGASTVCVFPGRHRERSGGREIIIIIKAVLKQAWFITIYFFKKIFYKF